MTKTITGVTYKMGKRKTDKLFRKEKEEEEIKKRRKEKKERKHGFFLKNDK